MDSDVNAALGRRIRRLRQARALTQEQLGERAEIAPKYLSSLERGHENPTVRVLDRIARALRMELRELFDPPEIGEESRSARRPVENVETRRLELDDAREELRRARAALQRVLRVLNKLRE